MLNKLDKNYSHFVVIFLMFRTPSFCSHNFFFISLKFVAVILQEIPQIGSSYILLLSVTLLLIPKAAFMIELNQN